MRHHRTWCNAKRSSHASVASAAMFAAYPQPGVATRPHGCLASREARVATAPTTSPLPLPVRASPMKQSLTSSHGPLRCRRRARRAQGGAGRGRTPPPWARCAGVHASVAGEARPRARAVEGDSGGVGEGAGPHRLGGGTLLRAAAGAPRRRGRGHDRLGGRGRPACPGTGSQDALARAGPRAWLARALRRLPGAERPLDGGHHADRARRVRAAPAAARGVDRATR
jgi:hypothetical protein